MSTGYMEPRPPFVAPNATVVAKDGDATLDATDFGKNITNTGVDALETIALTLPAASEVAGLATRIQLTAAEAVQLVPASGESIFLGGSGVADKYAQIAGVIGNYAEIYSDGVRYHITKYSGVVTKQA